MGQGPAAKAMLPCGMQAQVVSAVVCVTPFPD